MEKEKLYFTKLYNQWKDKDLSFSKEENEYMLYIQIPDINISTYNIKANFKYNEEIINVDCEIYDSSKRIIKIKIPMDIILNDGLYEVYFTYDNEITSTQTFTVIQNNTNIEVDLSSSYSTLGDILEDDIIQYNTECSMTNFSTKLDREKVYFTRMYDQWRGKDLAIVEEEINEYGLYIQIPDTDISDGSINAIVADFKNAKGEMFTVGCEVCDDDRRTIRVHMPLSILANDGLYEVVFSISYNSNGSTSRLEKTAIQTFKILDTIEVSEEDIKNDDRYNVLTQLIEEIAQYKVDTSNFPTREEVNKLLDEAMYGVTIESITNELNGIYVTKSELTESLKKYVSWFDSSQFATQNDLKKYITRTDFNNTISFYVKNETLKNYVKKEDGKSLSSNDFTNELRDKLINMPSTGAEYDDSELRELIKKKASLSYVNELFESIDSINKNDYYTSEKVDEIINEINNSHTEDIQNIENTFLKIEDYPYSDGINIDDINFNGINLSELLTELSYKEIQIESFNFDLEKSVYEKGVDALYYIPLNWELNKTPATQKIENYSNNEIDVDIRNVSYVRNVNDNISFTLIVSDEKTTKEKTIEIKFVHPYYYGNYSDTTLNESVILSNGQKIIDIKRNQNIDMSYKKSKVFFAYPLEYGALIDIKDGNCLSYIDDFTIEQLKINSIDYLVYKLEDEASVSHISFSFIFEKEGC